MMKFNLEQISFNRRQLADYFPSAKTLSNEISKLQREEMKTILKTYKTKLGAV